MTPDRTPTADAAQVVSRYWAPGELGVVRKRLTKLSRAYEGVSEKAVLKRARLERKARRLLDREVELQGRRRMGV